MPAEPKTESNSDDSESSPKSRLTREPNSTSQSWLWHWAQLVRLPNVFTVIADVAAAFLLVAGSTMPIPRFIAILASAISLYWAGMILNDVFDVEKDRQERSSRPLASGMISLASGTVAGWALLTTGVLLAGVCCFLPPGEVQIDSAFVRFLPAVVAASLALMIVLYDGPLKKTPLAPAAMGSCRVLSFLLGASPVIAQTMTTDATNVVAVFPPYVLGIAFGFGVFIMGVTTIGRKEAVGGRSPNLITGLIVLLFGAALMAFSPRLSDTPERWFMTTDRSFPILIWLIAFPVIARSYRAWRQATPAAIQTAVKSGVLSIIPLAAAFAMLGAGPIAGIAVFALVAPSLALAARFRVT